MIPHSPSVHFSKGSWRILAISLSVFFSSGLFGCANEHPAPPSTPSPPSHPSSRKPVALPAPVVLDSSRKIVLFEHVGNYPKALEEARRLQHTKERVKWTRKVLQDWSLFDLNESLAMYRSGHAVDATALADHAFEIQPALLHKPLPVLTPELWKDFLLAKINFNQELWVTQVVGDNGLLDNKQKQEILFHSYLHLSERRISAQKYHEALIDIRRALKFSPSDPAAQGVMKTIQDHLKLVTDKGYLEFTRQHLRRALFYWQQAVEIDPKDQDVKKNILKTKDLLKKLEIIERESASPGNSPATPVH
ncbi:MAG: tetratricopeptide repeat protein [Leptospirales bacterium]